MPHQGAEQIVVCPEDWRSSLLSKVKSFASSDREYESCKTDVSLTRKTRLRNQ